MNKNRRKCLEDYCSKHKPKNVIEFGSGVSTSIFNQYAKKIVCFEYDPPGNYSSIESDKVEFVMVKQEDNTFPVNLLANLHQYIEDLIEYDWTKKVEFKYWNEKNFRPFDLGYVDGAVHVNKVRCSEKVGWCGGDLSYFYRSVVFGFFSAVCKHVIVDDVIDWHPQLKEVVCQSIEDFSLFKFG